MSLIVHIYASNDERIDTITITNQGPPTGVYASDDGPGGRGGRVYRWHSVTGQQGEVTHCRSDGAHALVARVCRLIAPTDDEEDLR